jgi:hypothetical protein
MYDLNFNLIHFDLELRFDGQHSGDDYDCDSVLKLCFIPDSRKYLAEYSKSHPNPTFNLCLISLKKMENA